MDTRQGRWRKGGVGVRGHRVVPAIGDILAALLACCRTLVLVRDPPWGTSYCGLWGCHRVY